jgi:hypothetical protein
MSKLTPEECQAYIAERRQAGFAIDPATAIVTFWWTEALDPYGIDPPPEGYRCIGRTYFARAPDADWVAFEDLPEATRAALRKYEQPSLSLRLPNMPDDFD